MISRLLKLVNGNILILAVMSFPCSATTFRKISDGDLTPPNTVAVNQNFDNARLEFLNAVHKSSTETIHGYKYFVDPVNFINQTSTAATITILTVTTGTITNIVSSSIGTNQLVYNNGTKLVGSSSMTFNGSTVSFSVPLDMNSHKIANLTNGAASTDAAAFGQIPLAASQTNQETGTSNTVFVTPGVQQFHQSATKGWVKFDVSAVIQASYNVSSITDSGAGTWVVNWTVAFSTSNYSANAAFVGTATGDRHAIIDGQAAGTLNVGSCVVTTGARSESGVTSMFVQAWGDE